METHRICNSHTDNFKFYRIQSYTSIDDTYFREFIVRFALYAGCRENDGLSIEWKQMSTVNVLRAIILTTMFHSDIVWTECRDSEWSCVIFTEGRDH